MRKGHLHSVFGIAIFTAALAGASIPAAAEFTPTTSPWGGFYIGVQGGYGWGKTDIVEDPANPVAYNGAGNAWDYDAKGMLGGVHAGLDWESYALILGIEASLGYLSVEGEAPDPASTGLDTIALGGNGYYVDITGRIGFAPDSMLYYMKAGVAFADLGLEVEDTCGGAGCGATTIAAADDGVRDGWTLGVGIGHAFSPNISARLEYAYYDFGEIAVVGISGGNTYSWDQEVNFHAVTAGLSYKF